MESVAKECRDPYLESDEFTRFSSALAEAILWGEGPMTASARKLGFSFVLEPGISWFFLRHPMKFEPETIRLYRLQGTNSSRAMVRSRLRGIFGREGDIMFDEIEQKMKEFGWP